MEIAATPRAWTLSAGRIGTVMRPIGGATIAKSCVIHALRATNIAYDAMAPSNASTALSTHCSHTRRPRDAPIAIRTASSPCRAAPRASTRFARLVHAATSTITISRMIVKPTRRVPPSSSFGPAIGFTAQARVVACNGSRPPASGSSRSSRCAVAVSSADAMASVAPGASRPNTVMRRCCRSAELTLSAVMPASAPSGIHRFVTRGRANGPTNSAGATPITSKVCPAMRMVRPAMARSPANRRFQNS